MPDSFTAADQRARRRSNVFVVAALDGPDGGGLAPVRVHIRNLSPQGALIEGSPLPEIGAGVRLSRGPLSVSGELLWRDQCRAGLRFSSPVCVADWLPGASHAGQQRVDEILVEVRSGRDLADLPQVAASGPNYAELAQVLTSAGEELIADPRIAADHPAALQVIAIAAQALARLARTQ